MFHWLRPRAIPSVIAPPSTEQNHFLHGFDLREWNYLGYSEIFYTFDNYPDTKYAANVFFFILKNDDKVRQYTIRHHHKNSNFEFHNHMWINTIAAPWRANQVSWWDPIRSCPSKHTKDRMLLDHDCVWDQNTNWWIRATEAEKYNASMKKQRKPKSKETTKVEENVVKVDFNAKNNEDA